MLDRPDDIYLLGIRFACHRLKRKYGSRTPHFFFSESNYTCMFHVYVEKLIKIYKRENCSTKEERININCFMYL